MLGERDQAIAFFSGQVYDQAQRQLMAEVMAREEVRALRVRIPGHTMLVRLCDGKAHVDDVTEDMIGRGTLNNNQIRDLANALRNRLGLEPIPYR